MVSERLDVLIVGAGLSGIGAAAEILRALPTTRLAVLEAREALGGTWDVFRYPGMRSDSDMHTLGYRFRAWTGAGRTASGDEIRRYLQDTVAEHDLTRHIHLRHRVVAAHWHTDEACWHVEVEVSGGDDAQPLRRTVRTRFLYACTGYYRMDQGHRPAWEGEHAFTGTWVHPQHWPATLEVSGRRVVVIGSGATAVTLVPALAARGAHVTMLQRSPSYVDVRSQQDTVARVLLNGLPPRMAGTLLRHLHAARQVLVHRLSRLWPETARRHLLRGVSRALGPRQDLLPHFTPSYRPWDQRVCLAPDGDLFTALREGRAEVITDRIARVRPDGLELASGRHLPADILVTATGLDLLALGGMSLTVDGTPVVLRRTFSHRGMMLAGVPNFAYAFGYTHASWTLRAELATDQIVRVLRHLTRTGLRQCTPRAPADLRTDRRLDFTPGYVLRNLHCFPKAGDQGPWRTPDNALLDRWRLRLAGVDDGALVFDNPTPRTSR